MVNFDIEFFQYSKFKDIEEIGAGGYGTVYKAECGSLDERVVVHKRFRNFDGMPDLFIAEVGSHWTVIYNVIFDYLYRFYLIL
jgi:hypothetical protein